MTPAATINRAEKRQSRKRWSKCTHVSRAFGQKLHQFLKEIWVSILLVAIVGGVTVGVWIAPHAFHRLFPVTFYASSGDIVWTQFAYPYQEPVFSSLAAALVGILIPLGGLLVCQIWIRSFCDAAYSILGLTYSLLTGTLITVVLKKTIGGFRPHFLSVCKPSIPLLLESGGTGYQNIMFTIEQVCTGTDKRKLGEAIESFPSGHSEIAFAGLFYLTIYLFAHLGIQRRYQAGYWRMMACVLPILLATYLASTLVLVYHHHSHDVISGSLVGMLVASLAYRMCFRGILDKELNSLPACHEHHDDKQSLPG